MDMAGSPRSDAMTQSRSAGRACGCEIKPKPVFAPSRMTSRRPPKVDRVVRMVVRASSRGYSHRFPRDHFATSSRRNSLNTPTACRRLDRLVMAAPFHGRGGGAGAGGRGKPWCAQGVVDFEFLAPSAIWSVVSNSPGCNLCNCRALPVDRDRLVDRHGYRNIVGILLSRHASIELLTPALPPASAAVWLLVVTCHRAADGLCGHDGRDRERAAATDRCRADIFVLAVKKSSDTPVLALDHRRGPDFR